VVSPIERMTEQHRRAAEEALEDAPTDPRLPTIVLAEEIEDPSRDDLPPGFGVAPFANRYAAHPATTPTFTTLTFRPRPEPWYRTNAAKVVLLVLGLAAVAASVVALLWPSSDSATRDSGTTTTPAPSPSATPSQTQSDLQPPAPAELPPGAGLPPPPPPPPAPPPPPEAAPPAAPRQYYPRYTEPSAQKPPQHDVTRAPMSVAPSIKQTPAQATPGRKGGRGGWPW
jgi:hypothetical protein